MTVQQWSTTAASNNSSPPTGAPEGMAAAAVNNTMREMMASIAIEAQINRVKYVNSASGTNTITGSLTPALTAYGAGMMLVFQPAGNSTGAATINIDSLGAKSIVRGDGSALESGDLQASAVHLLVYDGTSFVCLNPISFSLVNGTLSGNFTCNGSLTTDNTTADEIGFKGLPQNPAAGPYTLVLTDAGKSLYFQNSAATYTIPANSSVAFAIGTAITFINENGGNCSIAITTDTMTLAGTTTTGTRTLGQNGIATAVKTTATRWLIAGTGLT